MLICHVAGARPNFVKLAPVVAALAARGVPQRLVHTGQHYDDALSAAFFRDLRVPPPDVCLNVGPGTAETQTARILLALGDTLRSLRPDWVVVYGDVTSTLAAALAAAQCGIPVAHVEAGLRSFDPTMPEELNRRLTDQAATLLLTTEPAARRNLRREGIPAARIRFVGNCMVDSLVGHLPEALAREPWRAAGLAPGAYGLLTLHRPGNVDDPAVLRRLLALAADVAASMPLLFPVHPRTQARLEALGAALPAGLLARAPLGYLEFLGLMARARVVLTDSGGIQEETTALGVPCLTLRANTERPITVRQGTNRLVGTDPARVARALRRIAAGRWPTARRPPLWDGHAGERVAAELLRPNARAARGGEARP